MSAPLLRSTELDLVFGALADSTRRGILAHVADNDAVAVNDLVALFHISQPAISKHLKVLERAGLVVRERDGQLRPVRLHAAPMRTAAAWLGHYEAHWSQRLDGLALYVADLQRQRVTTSQTTAKKTTAKKTTAKKTTAKKTTAKKPTKEKPHGRPRH